MKATVRQQYRDKVSQLFDLKAIRAISRPKEGWIRTLRKALGMSSPQLADRLGLSKAQVTQMERMEAEDRITLKQLRRVAESLNAELVYAIVPREPVDRVLQERARQKARQLVEKAHSQMRLEAQQLSTTDLERQVELETRRLLSTMPRTLWSD